MGKIKTLYYVCTYESEAYEVWESVGDTLAKCRDYIAAKPGWILFPWFYWLVYIWQVCW